MKVLGEVFINNNWGNLKIILNDEECDLNSIFWVSELDKRDGIKNNEVELHFYARDCINTSLSMFSMFSECVNLKSVNFLDTFDTSNVTDMYKMFYGCKSLNTITGISNWNTGNVEDMRDMLEDVHH